MIGEQATGNLEGVVMSAVSYQGISVTIDGKPAHLAIVTSDGHVVASGEKVAQEAEAVVLNSYRNFLQGKGHLVVHSKPITCS